MIRLKISKSRKQTTNKKVYSFGLIYSSLVIFSILSLLLDDTKFVSAQLEAVNAVLSVVPVTSILATAGLVGVKLAALSRLLHVLGYDQAYLANGGAGTAAEPIGLQTNYAYMFPYVPGLNISVKGSSGTQFENLAGQKDAGYSTTRKTFPAMSIPGDYEQQFKPFRGSETLRDIFRDSGINIHFPQQQPTTNGLIPKGNAPQQKPNEQHQFDHQPSATTPLYQPTHHPINVNSNENSNNHYNNHQHQPEQQLPPPPPVNNNLNQPIGNDHGNHPQSSSSSILNRVYPTNVHNDGTAPYGSPSSHFNPPVQPNNPQVPNKPSSLNFHPPQGRQDQHQSFQDSQNHNNPQSQPNQSGAPQTQHQPTPNSSHNNQNSQVNMPHPSNIRPHNSHKHLNASFLATTSSQAPLTPQVMPSSTPPTSSSPSSQLQRVRPEVSTPKPSAVEPPSPVSLNSILSANPPNPNFHPAQNHFIPQHEFFSREYQNILRERQWTNNELEGINSLPSGPIEKSADPSFSFSTTTNSDRQDNSATGDGLVSGPISSGPNPSDSQTNFYPFPFITDSPPFHDEMVQNEMMNFINTRKKRDVSAGPAATPEHSTGLNQLLMKLREQQQQQAQSHHKLQQEAANVPLVAAPTHLQAQPHQPEVKERIHENFGMPATNIHSLRRKRRSLASKLLLVA